LIDKFGIKENTLATKSTIGRTFQTLAPWLSLGAPDVASWVLAKLFTTPLSRPALKQEQDLFVKAQRSVVRFDAKRTMPVYSWGQGPVVLLVHGWAGRGSQLRTYVAPLVEQGFRVVMYDAPAHGNADGRSSSLPEFALAVEKVAAHVGPVFAVIAHSMGTGATTLALSRGMYAERLVYLAPTEDLQMYLSRLAGTLGFSDSVAKQAQARLERRFGVPFAQARGAVLAPQLEQALLAFHDSGDREVPIHEGQRLVEHWPGARMVTTQGLGHNRIVHDPDVLAQAIAFLAENSPRSEVTA
jgi:pimeloyl-ACP methyl ester carboxylesterase